jgi:competence protein ComEA
MKSMHRFAVCVFSGGALLLPLLVAGAGPAQEPKPAPAGAVKSDLPAGEGKDLLVKTCTGCHQLTVVTAQRKNESGWTDTIVEMRGRGAMGSDEDMEKIIHYLATNFGTDPAPAVPDATPGSVAPKTDAKGPTNF